MAGHHFEPLGPEPTNELPIQVVRCIYCEVQEARDPAPFDQANPKPLATRLYEARTIPPDAECPKAPDNAPTAALKKRGIVNSILHPRGGG